MDEDKAYKLLEQQDFLKSIRLEGFHVEDNQVIYPLRHKPMTCKIDSAYAGKIVGDYLIVNTSYTEVSCRFCRRAISKLQKLAREWGE